MQKISQSGDPDPTILNNSYGVTFSTGNTNGSTYTIGYRGNTLTYTGTEVTLLFLPIVVLLEIINNSP